MPPCRRPQVEPPYLLVGQSQGALFSRLFAATYPDEVAGLLLLDPWPEDFDNQLKALVTDEQWTAYERLLASEPDNEVIDFHATYDELRSAGRVTGCPPPDPVPRPTAVGGLLSGGMADRGAGTALASGCKQDLAKLTPSGEQRVVPDSGHMIHQATPDVVVAAIAEMVERAKS